MKSSNGYEFVARTLLNNTVDMKALESTVIDTVHNSYWYLYNLQLEINGILRFDISPEDCRTRGGRTIFYIQHDIIETIARKTFRTGEFYQKDLQLSDIARNRNTFIKMPLLIINGRSFFDYYVRPDIDMTLFSLPKMDLSNAKVTVFFLFNNGYQEVKANRYIVDRHDWDLPENFFSKELIDLTSDSLLTFYSDGKSSTMFGSANYTDNGISLNPTSTEQQMVENNKEVDINVVSVRDLYSMEKIYYTHERYDGTIAAELFVIEEPNTTDPYKMPVPVENIIILKNEDGTDDFTFAHSVSIRLYYPHIYEIIDPDMTIDTRYEVFYFYQHNYEDLKFTNYLKVYFELLRANDTVAVDFEMCINHLYFHEYIEFNNFIRFCSIKLGKIDPDIRQLEYEDLKLHPVFLNHMECDSEAVNGKPNVIRVNPDIFTVGRHLNEPPFTFEGGLGNIYDINGYKFMVNRALAHEENKYIYNHPDFFSQRNDFYHFDYKIDKMNQFIDWDADVLRTYTKRLPKIQKRYGLFINTLDMEHRVRYDTSPETEGYYKTIKLEDPSYMFAFRNETKNILNFRIFVDGTRFIPKCIVHIRGVEYIYIPMYLIRKNSYIEIESFDDFIESGIIHFSGMGNQTLVNLPLHRTTAKPTLKDLTFTELNRDNDGSEKNTFVEIDMDNINIDVNVNNIALSAKICDTCYISSFLVSPANGEYSNRSIFYTVDKEATIHDFKIDFEDLFIVNLGIMWCQRDKIRLFRNGRLIPRKYYYIFRDGHDVKLITLFKCKYGDIMSVDKSAYTYENIYYLDEIGSSQIVDFQGIVSRPFDLDYYDIYLNGKKLTDNNVVYMTPTKIKIVNVGSRLHLDVYQKDKDEDYFFLTYENDGFKIPNDYLIEDNNYLDATEKNLVIDRIFELNKHPRLRLLDELSEFDPDIIPEVIITPKDVDWIYFKKNYLEPLKYINPDIKQLSYESIQLYPAVYDEVEPDGKGENMLRIDPDNVSDAIYILRSDEAAEKQFFNIFTEE